MKLVLNPEISKWREPKTNLELRKDLKEKGQLQNLVARKLRNGKIELLAGGLRYAELTALGVKPEDMDIKILENISDEQAILMAYSENNLRKDFSAVEEARVFRSLAKLKMTHKEIAKKTHNSETYVRERLHLLELNKKVQQLINSGAVPCSYAVSLRKLNAYPEAQLAVANKICSKQWDRISTIEQCEEKIEEVLAETKRREQISAKYGPCPKCGSKNIGKERFSYDKNKVTCLACGFTYHAETKDPWKLYELKKDAKDLGLEVDLTEPGAPKLTPEEVAKIVAERTEAIQHVEKPNPSWRSIHSLEEFLQPLIAEDNIQNILVEGDKVTIKLIASADLYFKAVRKSYQTGEKCYVTVVEGWHDDEKLPQRIPKVKEYDELLGHH